MSAFTAAFGGITDMPFSRVIVHPLTVRITHWLNALAMFIMIMSGWRIYNSDPVFPFYFLVELTLRK
jgi:thiosulfate reductase cytochrome b subunit